MTGPVIGDTVGSVYERNPVKITEFPLFAHKTACADAPVLTVATSYDIRPPSPGGDSGAMARLTRSAGKYRSRFQMETE